MTESKSITPVSLKPDISFPNSNNLKLIVVSYLPGCDLFHKIAVTCKKWRHDLPSSGILDQFKVITINRLSENSSPGLIPLESFRYGLEMANSIQVQVSSLRLDQILYTFNLIQFATLKKEKRVWLDLLVEVEQ